MSQQTMPNLTLFDLLARQWQRRAAVGQLCFNANATLLAIAAADGTVALARLADNEPPEARIAVDNGQTTIRPREGKPSPLISTRLQEATRLSADAQGGFLALTAKGELLRLNRGGEIAGKLLADQSPISAFTHCRRTETTAAVVRDHLRLQSGETGPIAELDLCGRAVDILSLSNDGTLLALAGDGRLSIRSVTQPSEPISELALSAQPLSLQWSPDRAWLACGLEQGGLCLLNAATGDNTIFADFPGSVGQVDWNNAANALLASGAYRVAGWTMAAAPFSASAYVALATGKAGFVLVAAVAAHPQRKMAAAGYVNGRVVVAPIGSPDELTIREGGGPVTALRWSADGRHLAIGDALGSVAIVTFPDEIFK
jgi:WD40 repeat protein